MLRVLIFLTILNLTLFGDVRAYVDKSSVVLGDYVDLVIESTQSGVSFPPIEEIDGEPITSTSRSTSVTSINGAVTQTISQRYRFMPTKSLTIPSFEIVSQNGVVYETKPIDIEVKDSIDGSGDRLFYFDIEIDNSTPYVGEQVNLSLVFKRHFSANVVDIQYDKPKFENLWVRQVGNEQSYRDGDYFVHKINFVAFPQKSGEIVVPSAIARVGVPDYSRDVFGFFNNRAQYQNIVAKSKTIEAKALPQGVRLVGEFDIETTISATKAKSKTPINLTLNIKGIGNIDDVESYELELFEGSVFANSPVVEYKLYGDRYGGEYNKSFAIIADSDFKIPSFEIKYFDIINQKIVTKKSDEIFVEIESDENINDDVTLQRVKRESKSHSTLSDGFSGGGFIQNIVIYLSGVFTSLLGFVLWSGIRERRGKKRAELSVEKEIARAKSDKELLEILLPYRKSSKEIDTIILELEGIIYGGNKGAIDKRSVVELIKNLNKERDCDIF